MVFQMPHDDFSQHLNNFFTILCHIMPLCTAVGAVATISYQFMVGIDDPNIIIETLIGLLDYMGFIYLFVCFRLKMADFKRVLKDIEIFLKYCEPWVIKNAEREVDFYTKCFTIYFFAGLFLSGLVPMLDVKSCQEHRSSDFYRKYDPCGKPLRHLYPFDATVTTNFVMAYLLELVACFIVSFGVLGPTMTLIGLLIHIIAQIRNCRNYISSIFKNKPDIAHDNTLEAKKQLNFCIRYHQTIIRYTERVYAIFNILLIVHISVTSIIFALILYLVVSVENYTDKLRFSLQLVGWIALLFLTCYYGQRIITESTTIADAAYDSYWYNGPPALQRDVKLIIMRGQRSLRLRVASVGVISLETFMGVLKTAYSFFTLLITISD